MGPWWRLNEIMHTNPLPEFWEKNKFFINMNYCLYYSSLYYSRFLVLTWGNCGCCEKNTCWILCVWGGIAGRVFPKGFWGVIISYIAWISTFIWYFLYYSIKSLYFHRALLFDHFKLWIMVIPTLVWNRTLSFF